ncbi:MAG: GldG family protein [Candidatus Rokubacteria bacterium]|nr:GldG family protein [Candidatus Rokubacteria bacterium]
MQRFATPALVLGLLGLMAGGVLRVYRPSWTAAWPAALIIGGLLLLFALYVSFPSAQAVWGRRTTRYGLNALVMIVLILGVIALVEAVSYRHNWRLDLTENRRHSLAPQTMRILQELKVPVKATAFFRPDQPGKRTAEDLLKQYAARSDGKFTWEVVDADRNPLLAKRYGIEAYGTVVLEATVKDGQVKEEKILDAEEEKLTNALIRVTREGKRVIYLLKGHGEKDPSSREKSGLSEMKDAVEKLNYEVKELLLARATRIPDDAAIVVVAGPQKDLLPNEVDALTGYIARAGKVFFMVDPFQAPGLGALIERYGLKLGDDVIIDINPQGRLLGAGPEIPVVGDYQPHPITQNFRYATFFPVARTVTVKEKPPEGVTAQALARTSSESWAETNQTEIKTGQVKPDPGEARGPLTVAAVATVDAKDMPEARKGAKARIVVIGDSDFATNGFVNLSGNRDFFLNTLSWLAEEENLIAIRPKEPRTTPVFLTAAQGQVLFAVPVVLLPLAMIVAGVAAVVRKRSL